MLLKRIITAVVALSLVLLAIFVLPQNITLVILGFVICAGAWEWAAFAGLKSPQSAVAYSALIGVVCAGAWYLVQTQTGFTQSVYVIAMVFWAFCFLAVLKFPVQFARPLVFVVGFLILVPAFVALASLFTEPDGPRILLVSLAIVWAADVGAYFAGKRFGRVKLAPAVSPGKSWEGVFGGLVAVALLAWLASYWLGMPARVLLPLSLAVALISIVGDLTVSMFKRNAGLKDSGKLFPGHGGVMDRVDSICAASPLFAWVLGAGLS